MIGEILLSSDEEIAVSPGPRKKKQLDRFASRDVAIGLDFGKKSLNIPSLIKWTANQQPVKLTNPDLQQFKFNPMKNYGRYGRCPSYS